MCYYFSFNRNKVYEKYKINHYITYISNKWHQRLKFGIYLKSPILSEVV